MDPAIPAVVARLLAAAQRLGGQRLDVPIWALVGIAGGIAVLVVAWRRARGRTGRENRRRGRIARRAEDGAERLLESLGFHIDDRQVRLPWAMRVDGEEVVAWLRADLLVSRGRERYVAEVKSGEATRVTHPSTRRQLLEYLLAFDVHGVLLVDMEARDVVRVEFPAV